MPDSQSFQEQVYFYLAVNEVRCKSQTPELASGFPQNNVFYVWYYVQQTEPIYYKCKVLTTVLVSLFLYLTQTFHSEELCEHSKTFCLRPGGTAHMPISVSGCGSSQRYSVCILPCISSSPFSPNSSNSPSGAVQACSEVSPLQEENKQYKSMNQCHNV